MFAQDFKDRLVRHIKTRMEEHKTRSASGVPDTLVYGQVCGRYKESRELLDEVEELFKKMLTEDEEDEL